jgi:hypothetical protein
VPHLVAEVRSDTNQLWLGIAIDFISGLGVTFDSQTSTLVFSVESVAASDITVSVIKNPVNTSVATLQNILPGVLEPLLPTLGAGLGAFPLPSFLDLQLQGVEVARTGQFYTLYANLVPGP